VETLSRIKIGVNLSTNENDKQKKTQMKLRLFEVPASGGLLLTEYHEGIEEFYKIDKEIVTFSSVGEFCSKSKFLLNNDSISRQIADNGYKRFISEHESKKRLSSILTKIEEF